MKIQYTQFVLNPALRGTIAHLPQHRAQALIDQGAAVEVPFKDFRERLAAEEQVRQQANPVTATVTWAVAQGAISGRYYIAGKCSAPQCSSATFDGAPSALERQTFTHSCGCGAPEKIPSAIVEQYRKLYRPATTLGRDEALAAVLGRPQKSQPVDLSTITPANPTQLGSEAGLSPLLFLPTKEEHVDKTTFGPRGKQLLVPGDEITRPLSVKI